MFYSPEVVIVCNHVAKFYPLYPNPLIRLKSLLFKNHQSKLPVFKALEDISFEVKKGQTLGIIGNNGAGKSTLLQLISGITQPDQGQIHVHGRIAALLELGAGFNPDFTGKENIFTNAALLGMSSSEIAARLTEIIQFAELGEFIDKPVKTYSSGMYVRLAFAIAIHVDPTILIVDEALSVGDARFQAKCFERIKQSKQQGMTLLFCSHDIGAVKQLCDEVLWLDQGTLKQYGDPLAVTSNYMSFCFAGTEQDNSLSDTNAPINHWGENKGSILSCSLQNEQGETAHIIQDDELITLTIQFMLPPSANLNHVGVAFAIRTLNGMDLVVHSTCEEGSCFSSSILHEIRFQFRNFLNEGQYLLVVAIEERPELELPFYHEFIEGLAYFSVHQTKKKFGFFLPKITQKISTITASSTASIVDKFISLEEQK
ncbi:MAG: ABC transporter ATP-binding protein [Legionella sp.]|nr:ABC transporter ATP-binding protein [Legionella sp.]